MVLKNPIRVISNVHIMLCLSFDNQVKTKIQTYILIWIYTEPVDSFHFTSNVTNNINELTLTLYI